MAKMRGMTKRIISRLRMGQVFGIIEMLNLSGVLFCRVARLGSRMARKRGSRPQAPVATRKAVASLLSSVVVKSNWKKQRSTMFCSKCGNDVDANAAACPNCGTPVGASQGTQPAAAVSIPSHLADAILVTIFCCWPFGIPAIVFAAKTNSYIRQGKIAEAQAASKTAATWTLVSLILGLVIAVIYAIFFIMAR